LQGAKVVYFIGYY